MITRILHGVALCVLMTMLTLTGCGDGGSGGGTGGSGGQDKPTVAYVTNGIASFWVIAESGARQAGKDHDCNVEVRMPPNGVADQQRMMEELLTMGVDGIAVSPIDPDNQSDILNTAAERTHLITHDSDAPNSKRLAYIGMDNYEAGRMCGQLVKEAMPEGGSVMIFVGRLEQLNAKLRRQGVIDELMGRDPDPTRYDKPGAEIKGDKYVVLDTRTDNFDFSAAKALAEDAIAKYPDLGCMVGLFAYNPPYMLEALKGAGKQGQIKVVGFDEADETLQGIKDGHVYGTTVQNPYMYGYESVRVLQGLARGKSLAELGIPEDGFLNIRGRNITRENVDEFWADLKEKVGSGDAEAASTEGADAVEKDTEPADASK